MTEEKLVHHSISPKARSLLLGMLYGATAVTLLGLAVVRPIRISVEQSPTLSDPIPEQPVPEQRERPSDSEGDSDRRELQLPQSAIEQPAGTAPLPSRDETASNAIPLETAPVEGSGAQASRPGDASIGALRVSNQTTHAVRVALLPQGEISQSEGEQTDLFNEPVHWDFAPGEGNIQGLLLSLPNGQQTIQSGDVLVAFAQDGSQRYWGPYIVGVTPLPVWQSSLGEWQLTLQAPVSSPPAQ